MKIFKYSLVVVLSIGIILWIACRLELNNAALDVIATFLSITTGFTITALSIIATSPFSKFLYSVESANDNSKTLLHKLVDNFRISTFLFITTIGLIIAFNFLPKEFTGKIYQFYFCSFSTADLLKSIIFYFTILSFLSFILLFHTFSKFVTKSATS
ncbi:hypothetical protein [Flavobacterium magnum]|uniref:hypothetical protein n=1 Tax=Flavobacterium magnum TaxID=2162713 RepID=UPI0011B1F187|nr:hypothetical protein [Flavobacterium magnum]